MIPQIDNMLLEILRRALSEYIDSGNIRFGGRSVEKGETISLANKKFTLSESGIGAYEGMKREEISDEFDTDGEDKEFTLSSPPLRPLLSVEAPKGTIKNETDDYTVDYEKGTLTFRLSPEKGKKSVFVRYLIAHSVAEVYTLRAKLDYTIAVFAENMEKRDRLALEIIKTLFREKKYLYGNGVEDIQFIQGYLQTDPAQGSVTLAILEYQIETSIPIEMAVPPIRHIDISKEKQ